MDWFRLYHEFSTDPKVQSMSEAMQRRLIMLMCLRCSNTLETLQERDICFAMRIDETQLSETKSLFMQKNFIDEHWSILQWDKRQKPSDSSTERVRRYRDGMKQSLKQPCNVTVTPQIREDKKREDKKNKNISFDAQAHLESFGVNSATARDWLILRKAKKAAPTETAFSGIKAEADKAGVSMDDAIRTCCVRGWAGFKASWLHDQESRRANGHSISIGARNDAIVEEYLARGSNESSPNQMTIEMES